MKLELQDCWNGYEWYCRCLWFVALLQIHCQCHAGNGAPEHKGEHGVLQRCHEGKGFCCVSRRSPVGTPKHLRDFQPVAASAVSDLGQASGEAAHWQRSLHLMASMQRSATRRSVISLNSAIDSCARGSEWQWSVLWRWQLQTVFIHHGNQKKTRSADSGCKNRPQESTPKTQQSVEQHFGESNSSY